VSGEINQQRDLERRVVEVASAIISDKIGLVEAARKLSHLGFGLNAEWDRDFLFFVAVDSETDHFPVGPSRVNWSQAALAREDAGRQKYELSARKDAIRSANNLIAKFGQDAV
jgi:hypothetical protein